MKNRLFVPTLCLCVLAGLSIARTAHADIWAEQGDAGGLVPGQQTTGTGPLTSISGLLNTGDLEDAFAIRISDPANFRATAVGGTSFDTQLFLFDAAGNGIAFNDDSQGTFQSTLTNLFTSNLSAGIYILAIAGYNHDAFDAGGNQIFADAPFLSERGPNAGVGPLASWQTSGETGSYTLALQGAEFATVPTPGAVALAGLGMLVAWKRKRN